MAKEEVLEKRIVYALRQMTQFLDTHSRQLLKHQDITVPQVTCLDQLMEKGPMTVAVLAASINLSPSTIIGILDRLEKKGLVQRIRDNKDRRMVFVNITKKGTDFLIATPHLMHNRLHDTLRTLTKAEQVQIANSLERLVLLLKDEQ